MTTRNPLAQVLPRYQDRLRHQFTLSIDDRMSAQHQQGNQQGMQQPRGTFFVRPEPALCNTAHHSQPQPQTIFNSLLHPSMAPQQNQHFTQNWSLSSLKESSSVSVGMKQLHSSLPGGTTVTNYSLGLQPTQDGGSNKQSCVTMQSPHLSTMPHEHDTSFEHRGKLLADSSITASSINVSTASYAAPIPQVNMGEELLSTQPPMPYSARNTQNKARLAAVPARRLAPHSIISLEAKHFSNSTVSVPCKRSQTLPMDSVQKLVYNHGQQQPEQKQIESLIANSQLAAPSSEQVNQRKRSSYSAACEATLRAQQVLSNVVSSIPVDNTYTVLSHAVKPSQTTGTKSGGMSAGKRAASEQLEGKTEHKYAKVIAGKLSPLATIDTNLSLQQYFASLLDSRGYSNQNYCSLEGGYYCQPTDLQKASYGMKLIEAVRTSNEVLLNKLLKSGLSSNPCNAFGESIIHMVCRRGDHKLLKVFLDHGCSVQVSDDFGRTPLHDACWTATPCFKSVEMLLNKDRRLLHIVDCRGSTPLSYVKKESWQEWMQFFDRQKEVWWAHRDIDTEGEETPPELVGRQPHSIPIQDPPMALPCDIVKAIASGKIDPDEHRREKSCENTGDGKPVQKGEIPPPISVVPQ